MKGNLSRFFLVSDVLSFFSLFFKQIGSKETFSVLCDGLNSLDREIIQLNIKLLVVK